MTPSNALEQELAAAGYRSIAGIDEVGRGCWAGPVVAAAVVLPPAVLANADRLAGIDDSKKLTPVQREAAYQTILANTAAWAVGSVPAHVIDSHGILIATRLAMQIALLRLPQLPDALLIDAVELVGWPCMQRSLIRGDSYSLSIAAASIVAKVTRDRMMAALGRSYPTYGFEQHKGYGTAAHQQALLRYGVTIHHRRSFRPIAALV